MGHNLAVFLIGMFVGYAGLGGTLLLLKNLHNRPSLEPCPHGLVNWDDCPDCCH